MEKVKILKAKKSHFTEIIRLIRELAEFEKLKPPTKSAEKRLFNDAFGNNKKYKVILAKAGKDIAAYAFYFFTYSSFLAKPTLYLEDIYVSEKHRRLGIGKILFKELIRISKQNKCGRMEWCVLDWNKNAINFYEQLGSKSLKNWIYYRLTV